MRRGRDLREAQDRDAAEAQATVLAGAVIPSRPGPAGAAGSSARSAPADVAEAIRGQKGVESTASTCVLPEPIKELGTFDVTVDLFRDVATVVTVEVGAAG